MHLFLKGEAMFKKILIAIDDSAPAACAADAAANLAAQLSARVAIVHVVDVTAAIASEMAVPEQRLLNELRRSGQELLDETEQRLPHGLAVEKIIIECEPAEGILTTADEWDADLIAVGTDSRGRLAHFLLGSTADTVVRRAPCPVMTVRQTTAPNRQRSRELVSAIADA
jgi:nucleotide-binding universal stress UspA family protein